MRMVKINLPLSSTLDLFLFFHLFPKEKNNEGKPYLSKELFAFVLP